MQHTQSTNDDDRRFSTVVQALRDCKSQGRYPVLEATFSKDVLQQLPQCPARTVVTGLIKANLPCRIALLVSNRTNSQVILDESGAEALLGKGDLLARYAGTLVRLQAPLTEEAYLRRVLRLS